LIPLLLDLRERQVVVIGAGKIATRKILRLYTETKLTVVSPEVTPEVAALVARKAVLYKQKKYSPEDIEKADFIYICTDDKVLNAQIARDAKIYQWVDNVSQKADSNFFSMAELRENQQILAISSNGENPRGTRRLKEALKCFFQKNKII
jgi:precorrin-2 dehydrogenase/sirohydrochlorin ferrochelatase